MSTFELGSAFRLLAACCAWPMDKERVTAVERAALGFSAWDELLALAERHRIVALAHHGAMRAGLEPPPAIAAEMRRRALGVAGEALALAAEACRLQELLDGADIPAVFLKGASLAMLAYGTFAVKHGKDIDLLVKPDSAPAALNTLMANGYRLSGLHRDIGSERRHLVFRNFGDIELVNVRTGAHVELHWRICDNSRLLRGVDATSPTQRVDLAGGRGVRTLSDRDLFAYLCVHGADHRWARLKWLADANAFVARRGGQEIGELYRHARSIGAGLCAAQTLSLCGGLFGLALPMGLRAEFAANPRVAKLVADGLAGLASTAPLNQEERRPGVMIREYFRPYSLGEGWSFHFEQLRSGWVGPHDIVEAPLPRSFEFLYPALRVPLSVWRRRFFTRAVSGVSASKPAGRAGN